MREFLTVLRYSFLRNCREPSTIIELVLLPLGLILLLGGALGGTFDSRDIGPTPVAYVIESGSPVAATVDEFLTRDDISRILAPIEATSLDRAEELLAAREVVTVIHVPAGFGSSEDAATIRLIERSGQQLRTGVVRAVLKNFVAAANVTAAIAVDGRAHGAGARTASFIYEPMPANFEVQEISREGRIPGAFDFYSISMLVLFLMYVAGYSVDALREDILEPIGLRIRTTGIPAWVHLSARLGANTVSGLVQATVIVIATRLLFGANWGDQPLLLLAIVASITLFAVALGAVVLAIVRDGQKALSIVSVIAIGSMIVSGGAMRFGPVGPALRAVQRLLPHYQGQTALLAMVYDGAPAAIAEALLYFVGGASIALIFTALLARRSI